MAIAGDFSIHFDLYNTPRAVGVYARRAGLTRGEVAIVARLRDRLEAMDALDIGVGAGRAVQPIASLARSYVGIDFAPAMIEICRGRFPALDFRVADGADLSVFADASFDFVFFSFNGIDCVSPAQRAKILLETWRVLRPGGQFAFASHNAGFLAPLGARAWLSLASRPVLAARVLRRKLGARLIRRGIAPVGDDTATAVTERQHGIDVPVIYMRPDAQIAALGALGFIDIVILSDMTGEEARAANSLPRSTDAWLYYLCVKPGTARG